MIDPDFGVCRLSAVPVLSEPKVSVAVSQLLFGDAYEVIDRSKARRWLQIKIYFDETEGWIDLNQHHSISQDYFQQITHADFKITTDIVSTILYKKKSATDFVGQHCARFHPRSFLRWTNSLPSMARQKLLVRKENLSSSGLPR